MRVFIMESLMGAHVRRMISDLVTYTCVSPLLCVYESFTLSLYKLNTSESLLIITLHWLHGNFNANNTELQATTFSINIIRFVYLFK